MQPRQTDAVDQFVAREAVTRTAMKPRASRQRVLCQVIAIITRDVRHRREAQRLCVSSDGPAVPAGRPITVMRNRVSSASPRCRPYLVYASGGEVGCWANAGRAASVRLLLYFNGKISPIFIKPRLFGSGYRSDPKRHGFINITSHRIAQKFP